jgi:hypothetical protein
MATDEGQRAIGGFSRRSVLRGGLLAGAGVATMGAMSAVLTGTAKATDNPQTGWGYCHYCATMFWVAGAATSACEGSPNLRHNAASGSYNYGLINSQPGLNNNSKPQPNWRWCAPCQGLFWGGFGGVCFAASAPGEPHVAGGTSYDLYFNEPGNLGVTTNPQAYWRWCIFCSLLYWQGPSGQSAGVCPAQPFGVGSAHYDNDSGTNYITDWYGTH